MNTPNLDGRTAIITGGSRESGWQWLSALPLPAPTSC